MSTLPAVLMRNGGQILRNAFIAALVILGASFLIPNKFTASTVLMPPSESDELGALLSGIAGAGALSRAFGISSQNKMDIYLGVLRSETINRALLRRFDLLKVYHQADVEKAGKKLATHTKIALTNEGFVRISVTERDPKLAADVANAYAQELDRFMTVNGNHGARLRREFLEKRLVVARDSLVRVEDALRDYQVKNGMPVVAGEVSAGAEGIGALVAEKLQREIELGTLRGISNGRNPRAEQLTAELRQIDLQIARIPPASTALARLVRDTRVQEKIVLVLTDEHEHAKLMEQKDVATVDVVDPAVPPLHKSQPRRGIIALGAFFAAALASAALYWLRGGVTPQL
jgi:capsule polysaccharide export protein KpsE/RkpR